MSIFLEKTFHIKARGSSLKNEIVGGLLIFVCMCYIMPVNSALLGEMGMSTTGVFFATAILTAILMFIMGFVANVPIGLSAAMGLNSLVVYTISRQLAFTWQETLIISFVAGLIFFILSLGKLRYKLINAIPKPIQGIIAASIGAFIAFAGLINGGIVVSGSMGTLLELNTFLDPATILALVGVLLCFGLMLSRRKILRTLAVPICILMVAIIGVIISSILINTGGLVYTNGVYVYSESMSYIGGTRTNLPILPFYDSNVSFFDANGIKDVLLFGVFNESSIPFGETLAGVFTDFSSYVAIIIIVLVLLFSSTGTMLALGPSVGIINENGEVTDKKPIVIESSGTMLATMLGTSPVCSFAESSVGISSGAKTGLAIIITGLLFLLSGFIYPVFYIFTAGSVTCPALVTIGALIFVSNIKAVDFKDLMMGFVAFISIAFTLLTYSISNGIGLALISYCIMMLFAGKGKEVHVLIYLISLLFLASFVLTTIVVFI